MSIVMKGHDRWEDILEVLRDRLRITLREGYRLIRRGDWDRETLEKQLDKLGRDYGNACFLRGRLGYGSKDRLERQASHQLLTLLALAHPENQAPPPRHGLPDRGAEPPACSGENLDNPLCP